MKLLNQSLLYVSIAMLFIIGIWSVLFYFNLKEEIRDSIDDGLDNNRLLILQKIISDSTLFNQNEFGGNNFKIHPIQKPKALKAKDIYKDTLMYRLNEDDLEPVRVLHTAFEHKNNYYKLTIMSSLVEEDDLIEDSLWSIIGLFLILITSIIIINNIVFRKIWRSFYDILQQLKIYRLDKDGSAINVKTNTKEFMELQNASNVLIKHSKDAYASQKQFTENASHELQTPIAIIINKLELLLESEHLKEKDAKTIVEVLNISDRLKKINNTLLLLAKIENKQFLEHKNISINQISKLLLSDLEELVEFKKIDVTIEETKECIAIINSSLAEILISNLIKNAIFHNKENGTILLNFSDNKFTMCNSGVTTALNPKTIFYRFEKNTTNNKSTGLGLAICMAICKSYGISLIYQFTENKHCFTVDFKNSSVSV
jgi:signal transduction histidine kinase